MDSLSPVRAWGYSSVRAQPSTRTSAPSGMENGYRPGLSSAASTTARPSPSSTSRTTNFETPASPIFTTSPTEITRSSIIEHVSEPWEPVYGLSNGRTGVDPRALYENDQGEWEEPAPIKCRRGHPLGPGQVTVGSVSCPAPGRGIHRTHTCSRCYKAGVADPTIYTPDLDDDCVCGTKRPAAASDPA
jgi:hypothetical protein